GAHPDGHKIDCDTWQQPPVVRRAQGLPELLKVEPAQRDPEKADADDQADPELPATQPGPPSVHGDETRHLGSSYPAHLPLSKQWIAPLALLEQVCYTERGTIRYGRAAPGPPAREPNHGLA